MIINNIINTLVLKEKKSFSGYFEMSPTTYEKLLKVIEFGDFFLFKNLISKYNYRITNDLLMVAIYFNRIKIVKYLIERRGLNVNENGRTFENIGDEFYLPVYPLYYAAKYGYLNIVKYLMKKRAKINQRTNFYSSLDVACFENNLQVVKFLVKRGASINVQSWFSCLFIASSRKHTEVVDFLLTVIVNLNKKFKNGNTLLHNCVKRYDLPLIKLIVKRGARLDIKDKLGYTPLVSASLMGAGEIVEYLSSIGSSPRDSQNAFELLGSTYLLDEQYGDPMNKAREAWTFAETSGSLKLCTKYGVIENVSHFERFENLTYDEMCVRALLVRETILGRDECYANVVLRLGYQLALRNYFNRCFNLLNYALILYNDDKSIITMIRYYNKCLRLTLNKGYYALLGDRFDELTNMLEVMSRSFKHLWLKPTTIKMILDFIYYLFKCAITLSEKEKMLLLKLKKVLYKLVRLRLRNNTSSWLHYACDASYHLASSDRYPEIVKLFLEVGADVNFLNDKNETPLHIADKRKMKNLDVLYELLRCGAHVDAVSKLGKIFSFATSKDSNLKCLSARVIKKHSIPFEGKIPVSLNSFVELH